MARIRVRVTPRASRQALAGFDEEGRLKVRLTSPPVEGAANAALVRLLAKTLRVGRGRVTVIRGLASREKIVEVEGMDEESVRQRLEESGSERP